MLESLPEVGSESLAGVGVKKCMRCEEARRKASTERSWKGVGEMFEHKRHDEERND